MTPLDPPRPIQYLATMSELLAISEPEDPRFTKIDAYRLPNTCALDERYVMVIAGPEAVYVLAALCERMSEFAKTIEVARQPAAVTP